MRHLFISLSNCVPSHVDPVGAGVMSTSAPSPGLTHPPPLITSTSEGGSSSSATSSSSPPPTAASIVVALYQGGAIADIDRNLSIMRKFVAQVTKPILATSSSPSSPSSPPPPTAPLSTPPRHRHSRSTSIDITSIAATLSSSSAGDPTPIVDRPDLCIFPELFLCGYCGGIEHVVNDAQFNDGPAIRLISSMAKEFKVAILFGYAEREMQGTSITVYNSAMMIDSDGTILCNYRKVHLYGEYERKLFTAGDRLPPVIDFKGIKLAILICFDIEFVEPARVLTLAGAELLIVPTANTNQRNNLITIPARAMDNLCHVIYCNRAVPEFCAMTKSTINFNGDSVIAAPDGSILLQLPNQAVVGNPIFSSTASFLSLLSGIE